MNGLFLSPTEKRRSKGRPYRIAIVLALVLFLVVAPEVQEGNSMSPTIKDGQVLVVSKMAHYSSNRKPPEKGKLVILEKQYSLDSGANDNIISRVAAVPGDTVKTKAGKVKLKGNQIYLLGDNNDKDSVKYDSRNPRLGKNGIVDMREIKGNVLLRVWPLKDFAIMTNK